MNSRISGLDALRGVAALGVFLAHANAVLFSGDWGAFGYVAVNIFFVISGYIMARAYEAKFPDLGLRGFMWRRWKRLYLPYLIGICFGALYMVDSEPLPVVAVAFFFGMLFLPSPFTALAFKINIPGWSLFFELVANALHSVFFRRLKTESLALMAGGLVIASAVYMWRLGYPLGNTVWGWVGMVPMVMASYLAGIVIARMGWRTTIPFPPLCAAVVLLLVALGDEPLLGLALTVLAAPILVMGHLDYEPGTALRLLGAASYPLYAVHYPILQLLSDRPASAILAVIVVTGLTALFFEPGIARGSSASLQGKTA